jgi:quercetin dioxygenase-like cupin family protein
MKKLTITKLLLPFFTLCLTATFGIQASADIKDQRNNPSYDSAVWLKEAGIEAPASPYATLSLENAVSIQNGSQTLTLIPAQAKEAPGNIPPQGGGIFPIGEPNTAFSKWFTGKSYLKMLTTEGITVANVTFEPGCRNFWHIHTKSPQILLVTEGRGYVQEFGKEARELLPGDVVTIQPGVKHWHGAAPDSWFSHLALEVPGTGSKNEWLEPVSDEEYGKLR